MYEVAFECAPAPKNIQFIAQPYRKFNHQGVHNTAQHSDEVKDVPWFFEVALEGEKKFRLPEGYVLTYNTNGLTREDGTIILLTQDIWHACTILDEHSVRI